MAIWANGTRAHTFKIEDDRARGGYELKVEVGRNKVRLTFATQAVVVGANDARSVYKATIGRSQKTNWHNEALLAGEGFSLVWGKVSSSSGHLGKHEHNPARSGAAMLGEKIYEPFSPQDQGTLRLKLLEFGVDIPIPSAQKEPALSL